MWHQMWLNSWQRMWAQEIFIYHVLLYVVLVFFLTSAAKREGGPVRWLSFVPFLQLMELARQARLPMIVGVLLALSMLTVKIIDFFYGFVSMARAAVFLVLVPAYWYVWWRLVQQYKLGKIFYAVFFVPVVTEIVAYAVLGFYNWRQALRHKQI